MLIRDAWNQSESVFIFTVLEYTKSIIANEILKQALERIELGSLPSHPSGVYRALGEIRRVVENKIVIMKAIWQSVKSRKFGKAAWGPAPDSSAIRIPPVPGRTSRN